MFLPSNITLQFGDSGDFVSELQRRLSAVNCFGSDQVSGFFDGNTVNGVTRFQAMSGLHADGVAGPETLRRLNGVISGGSATDKKDEEQRAAAHTAQHAAMAPLFGEAPRMDPVSLFADSQPAEAVALFGTPAAPPETSPLQAAPAPPAQPDPAQLLFDRQQQLLQMQQQPAGTPV